MPRSKDPSITKVLINLSTEDVEAARKLAADLAAKGQGAIKYQLLLRHWTTIGRAVAPDLDKILSLAAYASEPRLKRTVKAIVSKRKGRAA